jgi:RNA polymerase sigma-70 factor (ECF subfamily)
MSTTSYRPNGAYFTPAGVQLERSSINASPKTANCLGSLPSPRVSLRDDHHAGGHCEVSDDDLITAAQRGDHQAFEELCVRHSTVTKRKIYAIVGNREDAEDAFQDTLLRAYTHMNSFRRVCKFSTWLTTIGINAALMIMRKRRGRRETHASANSMDTGISELQEPVDQSLGPEGICLKQQASSLLRREVEKWKPTLRSVVNQYYGSECSMEEAAKALDISLAAAKSRLSRGRGRLRYSLARYGDPRSHN